MTTERGPGGTGKGVKQDEWDYTQHLKWEQLVGSVDCCF